MPSRKPLSATLVCYRIGFGDCLLLELEYASGKKHLLIDFGSRKYLNGGPKRAEVAKDIEQRCGGHLDAIVVTHRHGDHVNGFATRSDGKGTGNVIASLRPKLIVQPWTEHPQARRNAKKPPDLLPLSDREIAFADNLHLLDAMASSAQSEVERMVASGAPGVEALLPFIGERTVKQKSAVKNLMNMAPNRYVYAGADSGLEDLFPGMRVTVLGPPTLKQRASIRTQRRKDPDEFWQLFANTMQVSAGSSMPLFPEAVRVQEDAWSPSVRWFVRQLRAQRLDQLYEIVTALDRAMNNTSVNLLIEIGKQKLLFSGDAQLESWEYALEHEALCKALSQVTLYKVGHHGSRNATPKSLWKLFENKSKKAGPGRLVTVLSTASDFHGHVKDNTEVPRSTLVKALAEETDLHDLRESGEGIVDVIPLELVG